MHSEPLTLEILERLRTALRSAGASLADELEPGLSDEQIDGLGDELGLAIPAELRVFWRWQTAPSTPRHEWSRDVNSEYELLPPHEAVELTKVMRTMFKDIGVEYSSSLLAFATCGAQVRLAVDCSNTGPLNPVLEESDDGEYPIGPSFGTLFAYWAQLIETGEYTADERGMWNEIPDDAPLPRLNQPPDRRTIPHAQAQREF